MKKLVRVSLFVLMALTLSIAIGCKHDSDPEPAPADVAGKNDSDPEQKPAPSNFVGEWKSTDGSTTVTVTSDMFRTEVTDMPEPFSGTYTVSPDGKTLTTSEITLPEEMGGRKVAFSMKLKDGESDVMELPLPEEMGGNAILVKKSTEKIDLTGTWKGKVVSADDADVTIVFTADNKATLTLPGKTGPETVTETVTRDGNFFSIPTTWADDPEGELTGLISASGKVWLYDGSVFTKQQ